MTGAPRPDPIGTTAYRTGGPVGSVGRVRRAPPSHRNTLTHLTALVVVPGCLALGWWQVTRALSGNSLSWAYVFEWPIFAAYAVYMWWKLTHDHPATEPDRDHHAVGEADSGDTDSRDTDSRDTDARERETGSSDPGDDDEELASYNRYLAALNASGKRKHW